MPSSDEIKSESSSLAEFCKDNNHYEIPLYQRDYDWEITHLEEFWSDLINHVDEPETEKYFFGTVILVKENKGNYVFTVVDGQQRLTTSIIFITALRDFMDEKIQNIDCNSSFINHFTQIDCGKNSKVEYNKIQNNSSKSRLIDTMDIYQNQDSVCNINTLIFGGEFVRNNLNFEQNGTNAESNMNGVSVLNNSQLADNHTFIDHKSAHCRSNEMYKGVYLDESKGVFNGKIMVRQDSQKIDAFQANNTLLLSENATINSKPQLEIYADDVKCSHGCTIGQLDKEALFYMRSRGIGIKEAQAVLTYAFASEAINNITIDEVVLLAKKLLAKKLNVDLDFAL